MGWTQSWRTILGAAALVATFLTSPGVQLARAGEGDAPAAAAGGKAGPAAVISKPDRPVPASSDGPMCPAAAGAPVDGQADGVVLRLQQEVARAAAAVAAAAGGSSEADGMALNSRGYNYGATPMR